jgi:hypothetical protein
MNLISALDAEERSTVEQERAAAHPVLHHFSLTPVK